MLNRIKFVIFFLFFGCFSTFSQPLSSDILQLIKKDNLMQTVGFLSSDGFRGRLQGSMEYEMAARYVANQFKQSGLAPVGQESFLHFFNVEHNSIDYAYMALVNPDSSVKRELTLGKDYVCRGFSGGGNLIAPVIFAGFGMSNNEYDDYADIDVTGKIVMVFKNAPSWSLPSRSWGDISPRAKARTAFSKGAIGLLIVNPPSEIPSRELIGSVACGAPPHLEDFPMVQITKSLANELLKKYIYNIDTLYNRINRNKNPFSYNAGSFLQIDIATSYNPAAKTPNVVALWEGSHRRRKKEFIVVGAHLDHVGTQAETLTFPGANDNASGVAALVEIARALKSGNIKTKRSILFVVFSAEESGIYGSKHFVENSPVSTDKMVAMLNFDCVGQGDSIAIGGKHSFPIIWDFAKELDEKYTQLLSNRTFGGGGADAEAFYRKGIPTLYFNTSGGYKYLHLPSDRAETLNPQLFEKLTQLGFATILELANGDYKGERDLLFTK